MPATSITPSLAGRIWLKSIRYPFMNRPVAVTDFSDVERDARAALFDVKGRSTPIEVSDLRGSQSFTLRVMTDTAAKSRDMDLILAAGQTMFVHTPKNCPVPGGYVSIGRSAESHTQRSARSPRRMFDLPCQIVAPPGPDVVGTTLTWQSVLNLYGSWQALLASNSSWSDLLQTVGSLDDLVVL